MNALTSLARRVRPARHGETGMPVNAAAMAATGPAPAPTFTPAGRPPAQTGVIRVPAGRHTAPARSAHLSPEDRAGLRRVRDRLRDLPDSPPSAAGDAGQFEAEVRGEFALGPRPQQAAPLSRADQFTADMRHQGGLPVFRQVARQCGWSGLHETPLPAWLPAPAEFDLWEGHALSLIAMQAEAAHAEVLHHFAEARRVIARVSEAADVAHVLAEAAGGEL